MKPKPTLLRAARLCLLLATSAALCAAACSCPARHAAKRAPQAAPGQPPDAGGQKKPQQEKSPLSAGATFGILADATLGPLAGGPEIKALRQRGLLKIALPCSARGLCTKTKYGIAVGFEVELLRKISNDVLGVKENFVDRGDGEADILAEIPCGAPDAPPRPDASARRSLTGPYYYSPETGWLCLRVVTGAPAMTDALNMTIAHFYKTGIFQQVYKNWFPPGGPDVTRAQ